MELFKDSDQNENLKCCVINPKSITLEQLFGRIDSSSGEWIDGTYEIFFRNYARSVLMVNVNFGRYFVTNISRIFQ